MGKHQTINGDMSTVGMDKKNVRALAVEEMILPMENRVMLDANLEWDLTSADAALTVLSSVAMAFEDAFGETLMVLKGLTDSAASAFDTFDTIISAGSDEGLGDLGVIADTVDQIRQAVEQVKKGSVSAIKDLLGEPFSADVAKDFNSALAVKNTDKDAKLTEMQADNINAIITFDKLVNSTVSDSLDTLLASFNTGDVDAATARQLLEDAVSGRLGLTTNKLGFTLEDIDVGGETIVSFAKDIVDGPVVVRINLAEVVADLSGLLLAAVPNVTLPFDFSALLGGGADVITFEMVTQTVFDATTADGGDDINDTLDSLSLNVGNFAFAPLFTIGGDLALGTDLNLNIGFLEVGIVGAEVAQFKMEIDVDATFNAGFSVDISSGDVTYKGDGAANSFEVTGLIQEVGGTTFEGIAEDAAYDLAHIEFDGALTFGPKSQGFEGGIVLSSVLDSTGPAGRIQDFLNAAKFDFDLALTDATQDPDLKDRLENAIVSLASVGVDTIGNFLSDLGTTIADALLDADLDLDIPLTEISISQLINKFATFFSDLKDDFSVSSTALGFVDLSGFSQVNVGNVVGTNVNLTNEVRELLSDAISLSQFEALLAYDTLHFSLHSDSGETKPVSINLSTIPGAITATLAERLEAFAVLLTSNLSDDFGLKIALAGSSRLQINQEQTADNEFWTFALSSAPAGNDVDPDVDLSDMGFGAGSTVDSHKSFEADTVENVLRFSSAVTSTDLGTINLEALKGVKTLRFDMVVDGVEQFIDVVQGAADWTADINNLIKDFNAALKLRGLGVQVELNGNSDGLRFLIDSTEARSFFLEQDAAQLLKAVDVEGLINWVNSHLEDLNLGLDGAMLELTAEGELVFTLGELSTSLKMTEKDNVNLAIEDLDIGLLDGLELSALLTGDLSATLNFAAGIDLVGFGSDILIGSGADKSLNSLNAVPSFHDDLLNSFLDNTFIETLKLSVDVKAEANEIKGAADLALLDITLGGADPEQNFAVINAQFDASVFGQDDDGVFSERLTFGQIRDAVADEVVVGDLTDTDTTNDTIFIEAPGLTSLIGRFELIGGIETDGEGNALNASGGVATTLINVNLIGDAAGYTGDNQLSQLAIRIGDLSVDVAGISGIDDDIIDGLSITIDDLTQIADTFEVELLSENPAALDSIRSLTSLDSGDILDTLTSIANMLVVMGDTLAEKMPFLLTDLPLINVSVLDQFNFANDFLSALQEFRSDPQSGLNLLKGKLEDAFGLGNVTLDWDAVEKTVKFALSFKFLEDAAQSLPFGFDLAELLGPTLEDTFGPALANMFSGLVDTSGSGELVFNPLLSMDFSFGIDLSNTLNTPTVLAVSGTALEELSTAPSVNLTEGGEGDIRIAWSDLADDPQTKQEVTVDAFGLATLGEVVDAINTAMSDADSTVSAELIDGVVVLSSSESLIVDFTDVNVLFGADTIEAEAATEGDLLSIDFDSAFAGFADEFTFDLAIGDAIVTVELGHEDGRNKAGFIDAANDALSSLDVARTDMFKTAGPFVTIPIGHLVTVQEKDDGSLVLIATNFAEAAGYDPIAFSVSGENQSREIEFRVVAVGASNLNRVLGLKGAFDGSIGGMTSEELFVGVDIGAPRIYLDTAATGIRAEFEAGVKEGLNLALSVGPLEITVQNGSALINAGEGDTGKAFIDLTVNDIDGDANANEYDLSHIATLISDPALSFGSLFGIDAAIGIDINLPFSDSLGLFDPSTDRISWNANLLGVVDDVDLGSVNPSKLGESFNGELLALFDSDAFELDLDGVEINLPFDDITALLGDFNVLALLNDPATLLNGMDFIFSAANDVFDDYLSDIDIPIIGDAIGSTVTFFNDIRFGILADAIEVAETPLDDGSLPTTVDLLTGYMNDQINVLFETNDVKYLQAFLNTDGGVDDAYLYGAFNFEGEIFREFLDIGFDIGIPGLNLSVDDASAIEVALNYGINIGFGVDRNGFFLLNDTDQDEIVIQFEVDAGTFQGSMNIFNVLGLTADAESYDSYDSKGNVIKSNGEAKVTASLSADLFDETGLTIVDPTTRGENEDQVTTTEAFFDLAGIDLKFGTDSLNYEKVVFLSALDTGNLIEFEIEANLNLLLALEGNIFDPTTKAPIKILGAQVIPSVKAELEVRGDYTFEDGLNLSALALNNVRLDASVIYKALIKPWLDPIQAFIGPVADIFSFLSEPPISFVVDILGTAFPIIGLVQSITDTVADIAKFVKEFDKTGGMISFGSFDFIDFSDELVSGEMSLSDVDTRDIKMSTTDPSPRPNDFATFGNTDRGISVSLPLLSDPFAALGILMGDFESVDLVTAKFTLFNVDTGVIDIAAEILKEMNAPGWVTDIIESVFKATFELRLKSSFEVGFDLSGLVNFANSYDPERLLDGIFITADPGSILDVYIGAALELNAGIAGLTADVGAGFQLGWNDPNDDGKLRIPELIAIVDAASADPSAIFGYLFEGTASYKLYLAVWAGIPFFTFDITIFDLNGEEKFGDAELPKGIGADLEDDGDTAVLSVGSAAGNSFSENIGKDGDDIITLTGENSSVKVKLAQGGFNEDGTVNGAGAIIIPAGEGQNVVDMSGLTQDVMTITYTGGNRDEIVLSNKGLHVVFAGDGNDVIKAGSDATGTYVIFADGGEDTIEIEGGNVVVFGDSDFGMRDRLQAAIADRIYKDEKNPITEDFILDILGLNMDGTIKLHLNSDGTIKDDGEISGEYELGGDEILLSTLLTQYTVKTHVTAAGDAENITLGSKSSGNHIVLTGGGADKINVNMSDAGNVKIYSGDGDDVINASGKDLYVEAGGGEDTVTTGGGEDTVTTGGGEDTVTTAVVWGFGAQLGESGISDNAIFNTSGYSDGTDRIIGGGGNDTVYGQLGSDIIEGNSGDDELYGGIGNDFITGGTFNVFVGGTKTNILDIVLDNNKEALTFSTLDEPDGDDKILGGAGNDLLLGGGGSDTVSGGSGGDLVIGDFAEILLSANFVAEGAITQFSDSVNSGRDDLDGGKGGDVLIAGSAREGEREDLKDLFGSNVFLGDFGQVEGANITKSVTIVSSLASATGGDDKVQAGRGNDLIIGGEGADTIASGLGGDIILGDNGIIDIIKSTITGLGLATDGDDVITVGTPNELGGLPATVDLLDVIISGLGDDHINSDVADIVAVLDSGVLTLSVEGLAALRSFVPAVDNASKDDLDVETEALNLILRLVKTAVSTPNANDGDDVLISKNGRVTALLGGGDDTATLQDGETYILGDDGEITLEFGDDGGLAATMASSESLAASNNDIITVRGSGEVAVILGTGNDILYSGAGDDKILGDSGIISLTVDQGGQILASLTSVDGNDTIDSGAGDDAVIAGRGKDRVDTQAGDDWVIGDLGEIVLGNGLTSAKPETLATQNEGFGDADTIDTGADDDVVLAGAGADRVTGGSGEDILVGDDGAIVLASVTGTGTIISSASDTAFGDTLAGGDGNDIIVGGLGDDEILVGEGDDVALGDNAEIIFVNRTDVESIALANLELGGNDTITAAGEAGDNVLFGQFGSDTITGGLNDDLIIGDLGTIEFSSHSNAAVGQSVTDRLMNFTSIEDPFIDDLSLLAPYGLLSALEAGDDLIFGGAGADMIVAGFGDDSVSGGDGQDVLVGDSAILTRSFDTLNGVTVEKFTLDTNYAFETGGFDELNGNDGPDILIGNLGPDRFFGNTQTDLIFSDGYAGIFTAEFPENGYMGDTPQRFLLTSNFAGAGAIDVVSRAQQDDSVGAPLSTMEEFGKSILVNANELLDRSNFLDSAADDPSDLADLLSFLNSHVFIDTLTQLKLLEFDTVDILQVLNDMVAQLFKGDGTASAAEREYLLNLLIQAVLKQLDLTSEQDEMNQQEAEDAA